MGRIGQKLIKLKGRGIDELRVRGAQALSVLAERQGFSESARIPTDDKMLRVLITLRDENGKPLDATSLLQRFRTRTSPKFFDGFDNREKTSRILKERFSQETREAVVRRAEEILDGRFRLLGLRDLDFGDPIDWHLEPISGKRAPLVHWSHIDYLDAELVGDKKIIWELNRHQYLMILGRAYWLTEDERYADTFASHIDAWMDANPPKLGINWASSLEVAFRSISWLWALHFFKETPRLTPTLFLRVVKFLYVNGRHLETYLSTYFSPNTHLTGEALGLFYLGTLLPELRCAQRWRDVGRRVLLKELARHVRPDGVYFEQASYYHRYTTDFYLHFLILSEGNGQEIDPIVKKKLTQLLDHMLYITRPDGTTPLVGDDDGGRLAWLDECKSDDFRSVLSTGAALFERGDYKYIADSLAEETLWLLGPGIVQTFDILLAEPPSVESRAFPEGGFYVMRDGWRHDANYMLIDCGPHGADSCGHAHADALSFDLAGFGRTLLVDPGTYTYTRSREARNLFRSSAAHNTLTVDGESSSTPDPSPFRWATVASARVDAWLNKDAFDYFEGSHNGYTRLSPPTKHARAVLFLKERYWIVRDRVETDVERRFDAHFHFAAGFDPEIEDDESAIAIRDRANAGAGLEILSPVVDGAWERSDGWVSSCYGQRETARVLTRTKTCQGRFDFVTFLLPRVELRGSAPARLSEAAASGGRAFEFSDGNAHDLLLLLGVGQPHLETAAAESDFGWTWLRFAGRSSSPGGLMLEEFVLLNGNQLVLNGQWTMRATASVPINFIAGQRAGNVWRVATDAPAGTFQLSPPETAQLVLKDERAWATGRESWREASGDDRTTYVRD